MVELVFMYHAFCCGLAANELSAQPPPVGTNFWKVAAGVDFGAFWEGALGAFVRGLGTAPTALPGQDGDRVANQDRAVGKRAFGPAVGAGNRATRPGRVG